MKASARREYPSEREVTRLYDATAAYWASFVQRAVYGQGYRALFRRLRPWLGVDAGKGPLRALDCGTGCGLFLESFARATRPRPLQLFGIDLSLKMLERACCDIRPRGVAAEFSVADLRALPFRDSGMDVVMSGLAFEYVSEPVAALREMMRVARRDARFVLVATRPHAPDAPYRVLFRYGHFQPGELLAHMNEAGLREARMLALSGIAHWFAQAFVARSGAARD